MSKGDAITSWRVCDVVDAANYLDLYGGPDGSAEFCPTGVGNADAWQVDRLMVAAVAAGFGLVVE